MSSVLSAIDMSVQVPGRQLVTKLNLAVEEGMFVAVLGRNGSGKTLSLSTLAGLREPAEGSISLRARALHEWTATERARQLALMPQLIDDRFPQTVAETALIGRYPHISRFAWESAADREIAQDALVKVDLADFAERDILGLSGGERRRLAIAQLLAQDPDIFLLDEPTNHLDPQHQHSAMQLFAGLCKSGKAVVASLHDVNLASRYADYCVLLDGDGGWQFGPTKEVLNSDSLSHLFAVNMRELRDGPERWFVATDR